MNLYLKMIFIFIFIIRYLDILTYSFGKLYYFVITLKNRNQEVSEEFFLICLKKSVEPITLKEFQQLKKKKNFTNNNQE